ncbi:MAG: nuclear transport factor 2 family protein [Caulobacterales bacterium]
MNEIDRMLIEHACAKLVADYAYFADHGPRTAFAELFTEDGVLALPTGESRGRKALAEGGLPAGLTTQHSMSNVRIRAISESEAEGSAYLTLYIARRPDPEKPAETKIAAPTNVGMYVDRYLKTTDGWRIATRRYEPSIVRAAAG